MLKARDNALLKQLEQSQYLRSAMKVDSADAGLTRWYKKKVLQFRIVPLVTDFYNLKTGGAGAVPVAIETFENDDEPYYMPMQVNTTYKEIWAHTTAGVMMRYQC